MGWNTKIHKIHNENIIKEIQIQSGHGQKTAGANELVKVTRDH